MFKDHPRIPQSAKAATVVGALDFAIQREMDSILYYQEIKSLVGPDNAGTVDMIIDEERMHFAFLSRLRRETAG